MLEVMLLEAKKHYTKFTLSNLLLSQDASFNERVDMADKSNEIDIQQSKYIQ